MTLWDTNAERGLAHEPLSPVNFMDYQTLEALEGAAAWWRPDVNLVDPGQDPIRVKTIEVGGNLFDVLGAGPALGPGFPPGGPLYGTERIAVVSDRLWRSRYQADPALIGRQLTLNGSPYTIVGIMPPRFDFPGDIDVWQRSTWDFRRHSRGAHFMEAVLRLRPGVEVARAQADASGLASRLARDFAATNRGWGVRLIPLMDEQLGYYRPALIVLFGAVGLLIVIGCLNVASLLLTRALSREREVAVRTGARRVAPASHRAAPCRGRGARRRPARSSAPLAATIALPVLVASTPVDIPRLAEAAISWRVLGFAIALAAGATILFGLVPAIVLLRRGLVIDLKSGERGSSRASRSIYRTLVAGEVALACVLLICSGLLIRTVSRMASVPTGVTRLEAVTASLQIASTSNDQAGWSALARMHGDLVSRLREQPGITAAGSSNFLPFDPGWRMPLRIEGDPPVQANDVPQAQIISVTDGFFEAMGATRLRGRFFADRDNVDAPGVIVVNETFARQRLGAEPLGRILTTTMRGIGPLGRNILAPPAPPPPAAGATAAPPAAPPAPSRFEVIGVVADIRNVPIGQPTEPAVYFTARQYPFRAMYVAAAGADLPSTVAAIQSALRQATPGVPVADVRTWNDRVRARAAEPRLLMTILVFFGALAAVLAALGVYGLFSWMVALRRRELAIRLTLGARPAGIGLIIVRQGVLLVTIGLAAGWLIVRFSERLVSRVLYDVTPGDVLSIGGAIAILVIATLLACLPPAVRAMRVDPIEGLRE